ncbi:rho GTPase-activating protein 12-like [Neocloeon triangulifer]|uniref:rho GTPase-activating protein 12-like n=1 Tax=Neocloeon triangulifer TaxID=2078957 RepID=UPI00286EE86A|nr:rho GTPase-activating protein 12-like [Neocloeon triangulifer]
MDCSSASDKEHGGWKANPLVQGIEPPQIRRQDSSDAPTSFRTLCDEARRASLDLLKEMPSDLSADPEPAADDDDDDAKDDEEPEEPTVDDDLDKLTEQALSLVDEALIEHAVNKRLNVPRMRNNSVGSDLSDEVFLSCNSDMNCIFDHDGANTNPVPPPRRKKKSPVEENPAENMGQIVKQIQILTSKAMSEGEEPNFKRSASLKKKPPEPMTAPPCDFVSELLPFKSKEQLIKKQNRASAPPLSTGAMPKKCAPPSPKEPPPSIDAPKQKPPSPNTQPPTPLERKSSLKKENKPEVHKPVYSQQFSVQFVERKTYYPEITRDSVVLVPAVSQEMRDLIADETMAAQDEEDEQSEEQISLEESFRSRKGSNGSDIVAWKQDLRSRSNADEEEETFFLARSAYHPEWLSSSDSEGRVYFFAENSNDSTWSLPKTPAAPKGSPPLPGSASPPKTSTPLPRVAPQGVPPVFKRLELQLQQTADESSPTDENDTPGLYRPRKNMGPCLLPPLPNSRTAKSQSMHVPDIKTPMTDCSVDTSGPWASLENTGVTILKEGLVSRTKVMESGKKVKKNWAQGWALLTDDCMYFFKDEKSFKLMRNDSIGHPELCIRLLNSTFGEADKSMSSKKNAFIIGNSTTQLLCQEDQIREQDSWFNKISVAKKSLPENHLNTAPRVPVISREASPNPPATQNHRMGSASPEIHKSNSLNRSKSVKMKKDVAESNEDLTSQDSQKNIRAGLKKFFKRRPTMETLVKKGIWKDEPAFGSTLKKLCEDRSPGPNPKIPKFVYECIKAIEKKPENLKTDGIYRASGNLSQVQKIRLQVDQNNLEILDQEEEVHVLTGALKLFFRELKEPLIPFDAFQKSLFASSVGDKLERSRLFREIIQNLPKENHDTLKFLLEHLLRVVANQIFNRMDIGNLSIVFGPTLMWPEQESLDCMAVDLMRQNNVIVCLLHEFDSIFN